MESTQTVEKTECEVCHDTVPANEIEHRDRRYYCASCYAEEYNRDCDNCGDGIDIEDVSVRGDDTLCQNCADEYDDEHQESNIYRDWSPSNLSAHQSSADGKYITSKRLFSAEIECYYPNMRVLREVSGIVPRAVGISSDSSLGSEGVEFQTPKLKGKAGEDTMLNLCKTLNDKGFIVNRRAGLHLHLDGAGLLPRTKTTTNPACIKTLWKFYLNYEDVFLSFLPKSRRRNQYCLLVRNEFHAREIEACRSLDAIEKLWYRTNRKVEIVDRKGNKYDRSRYVGINLHSLLANGHLEIRYHSGTINSTKILEWVNLHQTILDRASAGSLGESNEAQALPELADKTAQFFSTLQLPERAVQYFKSRQAIFSNIAKEQDEEDSITSEDTAMVVQG